MLHFFVCSSQIARSLIDNSNQIYGGQSINICTHEKEETERQPHQRLDRALPKHVELWCGPYVNVQGKTFGEATDAQ